MMTKEERDRLIAEIVAHDKKVRMVTLSIFFGFPAAIYTIALLSILGVI